MKSLIICNPFRPPEIPTKMGWSFSTQKLFQKCKRKFFWSSLLKLSPVREATPFIISGAGHSCLAKWYSSPKASMSQIAGVIARRIKGTAVKNAQFYNQEEYDDLITLANTLVSMMSAYADFYHNDRMTWTVATEQIERWFSIDFGTFIYRGKIDLLPYETKSGKQLLVDHKLVSKLQESFIEKLPLDAQLRGYVLGATKGLHLPPKKVVYNVMRKCKLRQKEGENRTEFDKRIKADFLERPDFYFSRETLLYSKDDIEAFEYDLRRTDAELHWLLELAGKNVADPREWPCAGHVCDEYYRTCPFMPLCTQGLDKGTAKLYTQYTPDKKNKDRAKIEVETNFED